MMINVVAVIILIVFYLVILAIGVFAAWKVKVKGHENGGLEVSLVAGRDLSTFVGVITMIATAVGGGYVNGTAEEVAHSGLMWTLAPFGIFFGLNIAGAFYARKMREQQYLTMLDPFQLHYGKTVVVLIYSASLMGDLLWTSSILNALGTTLSVIASIQMVVAVVVSGAVAILYTALGSLIAVAYTDIVQLAFIFIGLFFSLPFIFHNPNIGDFASTQETWLGSVPSNLWGVWVDLLIAMTFGSIPWQTYFQRVLSVRSARQAQVLSCIGAFGALVLVIPSVLIGIAGTSADWSNTTTGQSPIGTDQASLILPMVINEFTPKPVAILGLGAISAAVMSSADSSVLATSSMFTRNIYGEILRPGASKKELGLVRVTSVVLFGSIAIVIALTSSVIYGMFIMAADIVFVINFPQLTAILYCPGYTNSVGAVAGFITGLVLRIGAGEPLLSIPPLIKYSFYSKTDGQLFPHRTAAMLCSFFMTVFVSMLWKYAVNLVKGSCVINHCNGNAHCSKRCTCVDGGDSKSQCCCCCGPRSIFKIQNGRRRKQSKTKEVDEYSSMGEGGGEIGDAHFIPERVRVNEGETEVEEEHERNCVNNEGKDKNRYSSSRCSDEEKKGCFKLLDGQKSDSSSHLTGEKNFDSWQSSEEETKT